MMTTTFLCPLALIATTHVLANLADYLAQFLFVGRLISPIINLEAQTCALLDDGFAKAVTLLTDAAREDERVDSAPEDDVVGVYEAADAVDEEVEGEFVLSVVVVGGDGSKVGGSCQGFPPGLLVENGLCHGDVEIPRR